MSDRPIRETVDLSQYPDLVVIYLGMRINTITGIKTVLGFGPKISSAVAVSGTVPDLRHFPYRRTTRRVEAVQELPSLEACDTRQPTKCVEIVLAGEGRSVHQQGPVSSARQKHRERRARAPRPPLQLHVHCSPRRQQYEIRVAAAPSGPFAQPGVHHPLGTTGRTP